MKRSTLLQHLRKHGCYLKREGRAHSLWSNPATGAVEAVPRHMEVSDLLADERVGEDPWQAAAAVSAPAAEARTLRTESCG